MTVVNRIPVELPPNIKASTTQVQQPTEKPFADILKKRQAQQTQVKFSDHAQARMRDRHIELSEQDHAKIDGAVENAARKGAKESLLLLNDLALVVSVKNRTVITAVNQQEQSQKVFTNIDSAVIIR